MSFYQKLLNHKSCFGLFMIFEFCFLTSDARTMQYLCLSSARICGRWKYSSRPAILALKMQITFLQFWMQEKSLSHMKGFNMCYLKNLVRVFCRAPRPVPFGPLPVPYPSLTRPLSVPYLSSLPRPL